MICDEQAALNSQFENGNNERSIARRRHPGLIRKGLGEFLPTSVQKSYFMLSDAEREVLDNALAQYRPGQFDPILVGGAELLKPALRLMSSYRLVIEEITGSAVITHYTRWVDSVLQLMEGENQEVRSFQSAIRTHLAGIEEASPGLHGPEVANTGLRSQYALRIVQVG